MLSLMTNYQCFFHLFFVYLILSFVSSALQSWFHLNELQLSFGKCLEYGVDFGFRLIHTYDMKTMFNIFLLVVIVLVGGCVHYIPSGVKKNSGAGLSVDREMVAEVTRERMVQDARVLGMLSKDLRDIFSEFRALKTQTDDKRLSSMTEGETDKIESLFFRYIVCRESLLDVSGRYSGRSLEAVRLSDSHTMGSLLGILARLLIRYNDAFLSDMFINSSAVASKLNAAYPAVDIPSESYDKLLKSVLSFNNREREDAARRLFIEDLNNPYSALSLTVRSDVECEVLVRAIRSLYVRRETRTRSLLEKKKAIDSRYPVNINTARVALLVEQTRSGSATSLNAAVALDSKGLAQIIAATVSPPLSLTTAQHNKLKLLVKPGDIVLTYRKGYLTNLFFPGKFIHGLMYVGNMRERVPAQEGSNLDLVEATGGGVVLNSLDFITGKRISRLVILRPRLSQQDAQNVMDQLLGYMGREYDMSFDFKSDRRLCCTEVPYHLFAGRGNFEFKLKKRVGLMTLTADDIIKTALASESNGLDVVCLLDEKRGTRGRKALLLTGSAAVDHLRRMMD